MASVQELQFRIAGPDDAAAVASLHADSWRLHYRGAYSDAFLDGDVFIDRVAAWTDRLRNSDPSRCTILAEDGGLVGFANTVFDDDSRWGALLDNLHVARGYQRRGIGTRLLALTADAVIERPEGTGLYVWVLEQNREAQAFYAARGAQCVGRDLVTPPGGVASRLTGSPAKLRYAWTEPPCSSASRSLPNGARAKRAGADSNGRPLDPEYARGPNRPDRSDRRRSRAGHRTRR